MKDELDRLLESVEAILETATPEPWWDAERMARALGEVRQLARGAAVELRDLALLAEIGGEP